MTPVRLLAGGAAWLLAVSCVATLSWFAIDAAGRQVGGTGGAVEVVVAPGAAASPTPAANGRTASSSSSGAATSGVTSADAATGGPVSRDSSTGRTPPGSGASPTSPPRPATTAPHRDLLRLPASGAPRAARTSPLPSAPSSAASSTGPSTQPTRTPTPTPTSSAQDRLVASSGSATTSGGEVTVWCQGDDVEDWSARPANGWSVEVQMLVSSMEVTFTQSSDGTDGSHTAVVRAVCGGGQVTFAVEEQASAS